VLWGVAGWLQMSSDRWIIEKYLSTADVGIYSLLMVLSNVLIATPYGIGAQFVLPPIYEKFSDKENRVARAQGDRYLRMFVIGIAVIVGVAVFVSAVFGRVMVLVVGGEKYVGESYLLPLLVLGGGFFHIGQSLCLKGLALNRPRIYAIPKVGGGFLAVGMNILMVNWFGLPGVVWTVLIIGVYYLVAVSLTNRLFLKGPEIQ
jgi:O-antigen/teichoic acid export membrane protein